MKSSAIGYIKRFKNPNENLLIPTMAIFSVVSYIVFLNRGSISLSSGVSIGMMMLISAAIICILSFTPFYIYGLKKRQAVLSKKALIYNSIVLTLAVTITVAMVSFLIISILNNAFKNVELDIFLSSALVGVYSGVLIYLIIPVAIGMSTSIVARLFSIVMVSGIILSMVTNNNPNWWQVNFSYLGWGDGISSISFNLTLIMSGLLLIALSTFFTNDLRSSKQLFNKNNIRLNYLSALFIVLGLDLSSLGIFPYDRFNRLHDFFGYSMIVIFGIIVLSLRYIFPKLDKAFLYNSYLTLGLVVFCYILFMPIGYFNLTGFELIGFTITFAWLMMFIRKISTMTKD